MKKLKKYNKTFKFLMILGMFLNMLMPTGGMTVVAEDGANGKDLGNIFKLDSFKIDGVEAKSNVVVEISDDTRVTLDYTWDTTGREAKAGDYAEIEIPDAFKLGQTWDSKEITVGEPGSKVVVGTYSLKNNKVRFVFNEKIQEDSIVNGVLGFGLLFNEEKFKEDVVQEIEFKDKTEKKLQ